MSDEAPPPAPASPAAPTPPPRTGGARPPARPSSLATGRGGRARKPKRTLAKLGFFLVFLALFGTIDVICWRYESAAQSELTKRGASRHPGHWQRVAERWPFSYSACVARSRLKSEAPQMRAREVHPFVERAQQASRQALAPGLRWLAGKHDALASLEGAAVRVEAAEFDPLTLGFMALCASLVGLALALYQCLAFWRGPTLRWRWRLLFLAVALGLSALQWVRAFGPRPEALEGLLGHGFYEQGEFLLAIAWALTCFCGLFYRPRPERPQRPRPAPNTASAPSA